MKSKKNKEVIDLINIFFSLFPLPLSSSFSSLSSSFPFSHVTDQKLSSSILFRISALWTITFSRNSMTRNGYHLLPILWRILMFSNFLATKSYDCFDDLLNIILSYRLIITFKFSLRLGLTSAFHDTEMFLHGRKRKHI